MGNGLQKNFPLDDPSPGKSLHWALSNGLDKLVKVLLRRGADPDAPDREGFTPLQRAIRRRNCHVDALERFFVVCDELNRRVRIDARDKEGRTALHHALSAESRQQRVVELLLRRGADPNAADHRGRRPLHLARDHAAARMFLDACSRVQVDARDRSGRTPLQSAVADLRPRLVSVLLDHGADLSNFDFPTSDYLAKNWLLRLTDGCQNVKMELAYNFLVVYRILEEGGYDTDLMTDIMIVKFLDDHGLLVKRSGASGDEHWYDNKEFARQAKRTRLNSSLSLYDLVRLRPEEAAELVSHQEEHFEIASLWQSRTLWTCLSDESKEAGVAHMCETILRSHRELARPFMDRKRCQLHRLMNENVVYIWLTVVATILDRRRESLLVDFFVEMSAVIVCITMVYNYSLHGLELPRL